MQVLDFGYCRLVETWGKGDIQLAEAGIVEAARQSTQGSFRGWAEDERLLGFLAKNHHDSPFEFAGMVIEVQAPIVVAREWFRHRTQSFNEMSGRYAILPNLYYIPSVERLMAGKQSTKNKQSSEAGFTQDEAIRLRDRMQTATALARGEYDRMLAEGVSRELARLVVPVNQYTRYRCSANLRNWLHFLGLRLDPAAQWEIREFAKAVATIIEQEFPRTYTLYMERQNDSN